LSHVLAVAAAAVYQVHKNPPNTAAEQNSTQCPNHKSTTLT